MSHARRTIIIGLLLAVWLGAICLGVVRQGLGDADPSSKPLPTRFDRSFRRIGGLFVAIALSIRVMLMKLTGMAGAPTRLLGVSVGSLPPASLLPGLVYSAHAAARAAIYHAHVYLIETKTIAGHIMSDHVLLSSCVLAGLLCELYVVLREGGRAHREGAQEARDKQDARKKSARRRHALLLYANGALLGAVVVGMAMHAYVTARYFHHWSETLVSLGLGGLAFKWTGWTWVIARRGAVGGGKLQPKRA
jgi:hypothetical protein